MNNLEFRDEGVVEHKPKIQQTKENQLVPASPIVGNLEGRNQGSFYNSNFKKTPPLSPKKLSDYPKLIPDYNPQSMDFWKSIALFTIIVFLVAFGYAGYLVKEGKLTPTFFSNSTTTNDFQFSPSVPVTSNIQNNYTNNYTIQVDVNIDKEFLDEINRLYNQS